MPSAEPRRSPPPSYENQNPFASPLDPEIPPALPGYLPLIPAPGSPPSAGRSNSQPLLMVPSIGTSRISLKKEPEEYTFPLLKKGKPWAVLSLIGDGVHSKPAAPAFREGQDVTGEVRLTLDAGEPIQAVIVSVKGQIITGSNSGDIYTFLDLAKILWSRDMGDPRSPSPLQDAENGNASSSEKWSSKLIGAYTFPYSIPIPSKIALPMGPRNESEIFRLPQTFFERHTRASVGYEVILKVIRNKLRSDSKLHIPIIYVPMLRPGPPSRLRQLAYQQNTALLGPGSDPEGWHTLPTVVVKGRLGGQRDITAKCTFSLARPLCYTRGSIIPCALAFECLDPQALNLLSSPKAIVVRLRRCVRFHHVDKKEKVTATSSTPVDGAPAPVKPADWKDEYVFSELATWWQSTDNGGAGADDGRGTKRFLKGEIPLNSDLNSSSAMAHFRIDYSVVLLPPDASSFEPNSPDPLVVQPVEIATVYPPGPKPKIYAPITGPRRP